MIDQQRSRIGNEKERDRDRGQALDSLCMDTIKHRVANSVGVTWRDLFIQSGTAVSVIVRITVRCRPRNCKRYSTFSPLRLRHPSTSLKIIVIKVTMAIERVVENYNR